MDNFSASGSDTRIHSIWLDNVIILYSRASFGDFSGITDDITFPLGIDSNGIIDDAIL